jgi:23S rRNA (cytosine1962-C5)-methyltransferase
MNLNVINFTKMNEIRIKKAKLASLERKHPWVFSGAIASSTEHIKEGEIVKVLTEKGDFLAIGHFQPSTIAVRVLSFENENIDLNFFIKRIQNAFDLRLKLNLLTNDNDIFRLIHGEGDSLPGLIVDFYNEVAVVQCHSFGMYQALELISNALQSVLKNELKAIYSKSSDTLNERYQPEDKYLFGECDVPHIALENGIKYNINWITGQKTGFFIDQRENRSLIRKYAKNKTVLNTFCYSGGFSLAAIQGGATIAHSLDSSKKAIELTEENVKLNNMNEKHQSILADTMHYIKELPEEYDIIVLDPPAFAKHRDKRHQAVQGYKRLNEHAIRQIKPGGLLFTFSCSQVVDKFLFTNTIIAAAIETGRQVRIIEQLHQPADHPISAFHPEGEYLKGLVLEVN